MPPPSKKRKTTAVTNQATVAQQRGIRAFGKVSKSLVEQSKFGKRNAVEVERIVDTRTESIKTGGKRKRNPISPTSPKGDCDDASKPTSSTQRTAIVSCEPEDAALPLPILPASTPRKRVKAQPIVNATPTKGARAVLESFSFHSSSPSIPSSSPRQSHTATPPTSPSCPRSPSPQVQDSKELPNELLDLIDLYASFLTALSLYYAHHGSLTPVDLRTLCPSVSRAWRRRAVSVQDIQRILAIARQAGGTEAGGLSLSDYGHGKICIEVEELPTLGGLNAKLLNEEALNDIFHQEIRRQWMRCEDSASTQSAEKFITSLPLLPVTTCSSLAKLTPLLAKGQRRLEDLKAGAIKAQKSSSFPKSSATNDQSTKRPKLAHSRSDSLLSRIRAKETIQSTLPQPPTVAMLERKSALHRLEEVVPVLELLTSGTTNRAQGHGRPLGNPQLQTQTQSFTMPTLTQYLQMSLRNPISKDDASRCVRMLAELAPEWVGVREVGKCVGVTVRRGCAVAREEMDSRVKGMLEKL